jgi:hypothetical protein
MGVETIQSGHCAVSPVPPRPRRRRLRTVCLHILICTRRGACTQPYILFIVYASTDTAGFVAGVQRVRAYVYRSSLAHVTAGGCARSKQSNGGGDAPQAMSAPVHGYDEQRSSRSRWQDIWTAASRRYTARCRCCSASCSCKPDTSWLCVLRLPQGGGADILRRRVAGQSECAPRSAPALLCYDRLLAAQPVHLLRAAAIRACGRRPRAAPEGLRPLRYLPAELSAWGSCGRGAAVQV